MTFQPSLAEDQTSYHQVNTPETLTWRDGTGVVNNGTELHSGLWELAWPEEEFMCVSQADSDIYVLI